MPWIRQRQPKSHECNVPTYTAYRGQTNDRLLLIPIGSENDLWRCDECSLLWRLGMACDYCDYYGSRPHNGSHLVGLKWRHASFLQQLFYRKR